MKLILVRHGEAAPAANDASRELTSRGEADMARAGRLIASTRWPVAEIVTSPLVRTRQTGQIIADALGGEVQPRTDNCLAPGVALHEALGLMSGLGSSEAMVWVFHAPDVIHVAAALSGAPESSFYFPPGTVIAFNLPQPPQGRSMLVFAMTPDYLAEFDAT